MQGWPAAVALCLSVWLFVDGGAGLFGWRGLRSLGARPALTIALAILAGLLFALLAAAGPASARLWPPAIGLALVLHLLLAIFRQRGLEASAWSLEGTWHKHRVTAEQLRASSGFVPALFFEPFGPTSGAVILIHGAGAHKSFYTWPIIDGLMQHGFAVCAIDLDGHGDNQRVLDFPGVLEDVGVAVTWLRARSSWVGVVGVSLGGCVAARAVAEGIEIDGLALLEAPVHIRVTRAVRLNEWGTLVRGATWSLHRYAGTLPLARGWVTAPTRSRIGTVELIRRLDLLNSVSKIGCPLWLGYAGSDRVVPVADGRRVAAHAPPATPLVVIPRATHLSLPIDRRCIRALGEWLHTVVRTKEAPQPGEAVSVLPS